MSLPTKPLKKELQLSTKWIRLILDNLVISILVFTFLTYTILAYVIRDGSGQFSTLRLGSGLFSQMSSIYQKRFTWG